jgi:hypothetical protein
VADEPEATEVHIDVNTGEGADSEAVVVETPPEESPATVVVVTPEPAATESLSEGDFERWKEHEEKINNLSGRIDSNQTYLDERFASVWEAINRKDEEQVEEVTVVTAEEVQIDVPPVAEPEGSPEVEAKAKRSPWNIFAWLDRESGQ